MTKDEALELALEALEEVVKWYQTRDKDDKPMPPHNQNPEIKQAIEAITAMKELLAQPKEPDPVAWLQIGLAPLHEGDVIARTTKPTKWNPKWWRFEPLYTTPPQLKPLTGWQPIETAPRDGTEILMTNGVNVSSGQWFSEYGGTYDQEGAPNGDGCDDGWSDWSGGMQPDPTHWMPLPSPPIEAAHGIKDKNTRGKE